MVDCQAVYTDADISSAQFLIAKEKSYYASIPILSYMNALNNDGVKIAYMNASGVNTNCNKYFCII